MALSTALYTAVVIKTKLSRATSQVEAMNGDKTEIGIDAITKDMEPEERRAVARILRRNSMVSKFLIWVTITLFTSFLVALGAELAGLINIVD